MAGERKGITQTNTIKRSRHVMGGLSPVSLFDFPIATAEAEIHEIFGKATDSPGEFKPRLF